MLEYKKQREVLGGAINSDDPIKYISNHVVEFESSEYRKVLTNTVVDATKSINPAIAALPLSPLVVPFLVYRLNRKIHIDMKHKLEKGIVEIDALIKYLEQEIQKLENEL